MHINLIEEDRKKNRMTAVSFIILGLVSILPAVIVSGAIVENQMAACAGVCDGQVLWQSVYPIAQGVNCGAVIVLIAFLFYLAYRRPSVS